MNTINEYRELINLIDNPEQLYIKRLNETVVKPYIKYINNLNNYLNESTLTPQQLNQIATQAQANPENIALPQQVKQTFAQELNNIPAGPVQNFDTKVKQELDRVQDPEVKQGLLQRAKDAVKNPDTQQTVLAAVSSIAGMVAGAASMGLGADAAKQATKAVGTGLLAVLNSRIAGKDWRDSIKAGTTRASVRAAADQIGIGYKDAKDLVGLGSTAKDAKAAQAGAKAAEPIAAPAGVDPQELKGEWEKFVKYGQDLLSRMVPAPEAKPAE